ncbi:DUF4142 domain-containing protein [Cellvibrio mixtus]|uniref:DUF4142 domain-containing protein n=1 Tax=Cellvibrio mixtus TaxID=39650 RepID=UPI0005867CAA|nr:DUF4142 domain-containing protein [Cellvibrio mixtus]
MRYLKVLLGTLLVLIVFVPFANAHTEKDLDAQSFIDIAIRTTILEIKTAKLALVKSNSTEVKAYAARMLNEQQMVLDSLKNLARVTQITPVNGAVLDDKQLLAGGVAPWLEGEKFNQAYSKRRLEERKKLVALLQQGLRSSDVNVRNYAKGALPVSLQQLYLAQQLPAGNS